jgi:hypothetical protein
METSQPTRAKRDYSKKKMREIAHNLIMQSIDNGTYWD